MLPLWTHTWLDAWWARIIDFLEPDKTLIYQRCVLISLEDPETARMLGKREGVTRDAVTERMYTDAYVTFTTSRCIGEAQTEFDKALTDLADIRDKHRAAASETEWSWWAACLLVICPSIVMLAIGGLLALAVAVAVAAAVLFTLFWRGSTVWFNLRQSLVAAAWGAVWLAQRVELGVNAAGWGEVLEAQGTRPVVAQVVRQMLGDDPDSLFIPGSYEGLRALRAPGYFVDNEALQQLQRKVAHIEYGTIAICGPRGAGKTTLLERCVDEADFGVLAQAPATYTPHDFLLSLSVRLCATYIRSEGYEVPEFTRLSNARRLLRRVISRVRRLGRWGAFALPSTALVVLGLSTSARSLYSQYANSVADFVRTHVDPLRSYSVQTWQGHGAIASVLAILAGLAWWKSRHSSWLPSLLGGLWTLAGTPVGMLLALGSIGSILLDKQVQQQVRYIQPGTMVSAGLLMVAWIYFLRFRDSGKAFQSGRWRVYLETIFGPLAFASGIALLLYLVRNPQTYPILADTENPLRLAGAIAGVLLARAGGWRPRPTEPELVTRCRNHLYRLQTIQTSSNGLSTGTSQVLSLGTSHTTSVSTVPPNFPELVEEFRDVLNRIAKHKAAQNRVVVIAIDELDRLGSSAQALAFLGEIKAILGVPHVYYLISVAEDVGASFVRRGLPHRDVTDSSLDDIIHVQPSLLKDSRAILAKRCDTLTTPYVILAHSLSGGVLRDLLRYGLQIREMQEKTQSFELTEISRHVILDELSETLAGFRTLLSKQQWTRDTSGVLGAFRTLGGYLREPCPCTEFDLQLALEQFAFYAAGDRPGPIAHHELGDGARQLIDEASAYAHFSLTLLDIFSTEGLRRRTHQAAEQGPDGDPERLAEARQELGISPYSARPLIDSIRKAWSLPLGPSASSRRPRSRARNCPLHPERDDRPQAPGRGEHT
ncbi:P-loop NTPase fold protein [Streptomyces sp. NBC_00038]|uniref:P-loop NTPase fold protein n=1 Tax=Streptomyces sp. NBC_00038 TaxID=2903615 RepID=UPI00225A81BD|nr:P-loop NTPase fold protein [Streptomyces sp. NBC_00038]MCX5561116.1 P-loop NTPase fold protein [Streptomyces sp. NBC_00038]